MISISFKPKKWHQSKTKKLESKESSILCFKKSEIESEIKSVTKKNQKDL